VPKFSAFFKNKVTNILCTELLSVSSVHSVCIQYLISFCKCTLYVLYLVTDMTVLIHLVCVSASSVSTVSSVLWFIPKSKLFSCVSTTFCTSTEHQNDYKPYYHVAVICNAGYINVDIINIYFLCLSSMHARGQSPYSPSPSLWLH
jgi:hypothetical protein